jgi:RimJ/RimL family protein N-acetyltransferase
MTASVRPATPDDVEMMIDVLAEVAAEGRWIGTEAPLDRDQRRERFRSHLEDERVLQLVAEADGRVVGHLGLEVLPYGVAQFGMCVAPEWRGRGVGSALVGAAVDGARRLGAHKVTLQVWPHNRAARQLYRKHGFVEEGRIRRHYPRRNGQLWDAIIMGLVLDEERPGSPYPDDG